MANPAITEARCESARHRTVYLRCGPDDGPLIIFVHGWPERAVSWRHQLRYFADRGYLAVAPDMRGYGDSGNYARHEDYAVEQSVQDMIELLDSLGRKSAIWVGHDWGSPVVWSLASHHPQRCKAIANLCVPYFPQGFTIGNIEPLIDRTIYPAERFPAGQWEYFLYYREHFASAQAGFEADIPAMVKALFRRGMPGNQGKPAALAFTRINGGWFGGSGRPPELPMDTAVLDEASMAVYVDGLRQNGFFGPNSWYMNDDLNARYARGALAGGRLSLPVLFLHARFDYTCETLLSQLAEPMRAACENLSEAVVDSGHWMAQEQPDRVNELLLDWIGGTETT